MHFDPVQLQAADGNEIFYDALNDSHGHAWIGGSRGMLRMEKGHWRRFTTNDGLATNSVAYITQAKDGALWIGYREPFGVSRVVDNGDKLQVRTFTKKDGLSSDKPLFVGVDRRGWIWYGSDSGVDYYDGTRWRHYGQPDGLIWDDCDGNSFLADADGSVWIGTSGGLSHFHPTGGFNQEIVPSVEITRAQVGDRATADSRAIVVPPGHAPLFVFFSGLTFTHEDDVRFRYRLLGFEKDWVETPLRQLQYSNLPPGRYTLEVTARGAQGDWNRDAAHASVVVLPSWWETWWARLAGLILVLLAVWQSVRYREGRYRREQQRLASAVDQRTRELRVQTERIERKNAEIEMLLKDAQEASQLKSEFLANMSHEIRTPMNGVLGMTALTLGTHLNGEQREYMEAAQQSATSLLGLLNEILDFSKIDAGRLELESVAFSPAECVREAIQTLAVTAQQKGLEIQHTIADGVPKTVQGDPMRLRQVLLNLIGNAVKFTDSGSIQVKLAVERFAAEELLLQFSVKDTGVGIPLEKQRFIFEPFRQADGSTTRKHGGTGLGLAICARLVEMMGGRIWVESEPDVGSSFFFTGLFRLSEPGVEVKPKVSSTWNGNGLNASNGHSGLHVLVAEDNSVNQRVVTRFLEKKGNRVTIANNGREAVQAFENHSFDLVLMDVQMPEMDGLEATTILRAREQANGGHLPVLALTAYAMKGDQDRCMRAGMDGYVSKPVRPEELFAAIEQVLAAKQST
jgi:signal transduction histidine kinase/ActR/RegA family two-component response regulator